MSKLYNNIKKQRIEQPENRKRLDVRSNTMLNQRVSIEVDGHRKWATLTEHINLNPLEVYSHVYNYKKRSLNRIILDSKGKDALFNELKNTYPRIANSHLKKKRLEKARRNVMKKKPWNK